MRASPVLGQAPLRDGEDRAGEIAAGRESCATIENGAKGGDRAGQVVGAHAAGIGSGPSWP